MSKIDMRQTVEEAAHLFAESRSSGSVFPAYYHGFIAGAEWQAKKFPWISTKDKLPDDEDLVITGCWCTNYFKYLQQGCIAENVMNGMILMVIKFVLPIGCLYSI
ncbi:hypothetical protein [Parabacteroides distasonis]|jgi:hypothetical protein|uniref:hypothetical protein n=1 Tax=Parabacteroides distasonis TaxID=823 RepID=UPI0032C16791